MWEKFSTTKLLSRKKPKDKVLFKGQFESVKSEYYKLEKVSGGLRRKGWFKKSYFDLPLVTIITVVYNGEQYLEQTINSVLNQDYDNIEYIIIDGDSTDKTLDIIRKYDCAIDFWISGPDRGIFDAMNKGLNLSYGEYIGILNSDDWYEKDAVSKIVEIFQNNSSVSILHGSMNLYDENGNYIGCYGERSKIWNNFIAPFNHPTCFVSRKVYNAIGVFNTEYKTAADYDFMLRILESNYQDMYIDKNITNFRRIGVSSKKFVAFDQIWKILRSNGYNYISSLMGIGFRFIRDILAILLNYIGMQRFSEYLKKHLSYYKS